MLAQLPKILHSADFVVKMRGISLLTAVLQTRCDEILNDFDQYYQFFHEILENRGKYSIIYFSLNDALCTAITLKATKEQNLYNKLMKLNPQNHTNGTTQKYLINLGCAVNPVRPIGRPISQIPGKSAAKLIRYFSECLTFPVSSGHVNAYASNIFNESRFADTVYLLCECIPNLSTQPQVDSNELFYSLIRILSVSYNNVGLFNYIKSKQNEIINSFLITNGTVNEYTKKVIPDLMKCLVCENNGVNNFTANVLYGASMNCPMFLKLISPYSSSIKIHKNYDTNNIFKELFKKFSENNANSSLVANPDQTPFESLAHSMFSNNTFEKVDVNNTKKFLNEKSAFHSRPIILTIDNPTSLAIHLDQITPLTIDSIKKPKKGPVAEKTLLKPLKCSAKKCGTVSKHHYTFEYYPNDKALIWTDASRNFKKIIMLDKNSKVEASKEKEKEKGLFFFKYRI
ncbi:hypothetical protein TRFO_33393 [Tritrichomonas foetus]|uniref:Uncharacterized protein n=1 Tax=Tritrichomonas foetus TaxID=1144522 RepID=A0A1J4JLQ0_9EUKA|nr:hypothetical protein TRFO_33393 [Tritrichomonas foetus]|eukprot:OHT00041.1 hypothetical protein TRFO_33393 [Tritrichomonas foetus]